MIYNHCILETKTFARVMYFKFFMVVFIWGLIPLLIPVSWIPMTGLVLTPFELILLRVWGVIVLLDTFIYIYIYKYPHAKLSKYLILFAVIDNGGLGTVLLMLTLLLRLPWGIWIHTPFQLFFGYWFLRFYREGKFK